MGKIKVLEKEVSSKIAAGEVVERPVSIVKELVENSLDAGSKNITVEILSGGKKLIRVIDDGEGIPQEDIKLAFERHATSKISKEEDIFNIRTLGFRGEALASIAAVSQIMLISKTKDEEVGSKCQVDGGVFKGIEDTSAKNGCIIEVKNLFFNTPARIKFLKNDTREAGYTVDLITKYAICCPTISFRLINDHKENFYTSGSGDHREAIAKIFGIEIAKQMIYIEKPFEGGMISGFIALPQHNRGNRNAEIFFANNRLIKDKGLSFAVEKAFKTFIPINRFPICVLFISIESSEIDVNVHPSKTQIKFHREAHVHAAITEAIKVALKENILIPKESILIPKGNIPIKYDEQRQYNGLARENNVRNEYFTKYNGTIIQDTDTIHDKKPPEDFTYAPKSDIIREQSKMHFDKIVGQLFCTYIVVQSEREFYLIDQHAAHEKILYERQMAKDKNVIATQQLITPYTMQLSIQEIMFVEEHIQEIRDIGFNISIFGRDTILIREVPYVFGRAVNPNLLRDILDDIAVGDNTDDPLAKEKVVASMACHTAIKAGEILSNSEIRELLSQLEQLENPYTCPHGRPTIISMSMYELEKKFKRVQ
jgi:DNA mismatch repair protein MutL